MGYVLKLGSDGTDVQALQRKLIGKGLLAEQDGQGHSNVDGRYGRLTQDAVLAFQRQQGLRADGVVGALTAQALSLVAPAQAPPVPHDDGHVFSAAQLAQLAELVDACIPTGPFDLFDGPAILWVVNKVDGLLAQCLPPKVVGWIHDLSQGVDGMTLDNLERRIVTLLNQQVNLPLLSEATEEKIIRMVVDVLIDALHLGRTFEDAVRSVKLRT